MFGNISVYPTLRSWHTDEMCNALTSKQASKGALGINKVLLQPPYDDGRLLFRIYRYSKKDNQCLALEGEGAVHMKSSPSLYRLHASQENHSGTLQVAEIVLRSYRSQLYTSPPRSRPPSVQAAEYWHCQQKRSLWLKGLRGCCLRQPLPLPPTCSGEVPSVASGRLTLK